MKAFVIPRLGAASIELVQVPVPQIDDDELLVKVCAIGVGIHDSYFLPNDAHYPYPIGIEAAGVIEQIGSKVIASHRVGDRVAFVSSMQPKGGTWAQFVAVKADSLILEIPQAMDFVTAAAIPVAANTILRALHALPVLPKGGSVFIAGGSGAIGTLAIQIAHQRGWRVCASASAANHAYMRSLGAEKAVDYHNPNWPADVLQWIPSGVDAVVAIQPGTGSQSLPVVKNGGSLVTISGDSVLPERGISVAGIPYQLDIYHELVQLTTDIADGHVHVEVEQVFAFEDALAALAKVQTRHARGKLVLKLG